MGNTGVVTGIDNDNDIEVTYSSGNKWTFNSAVLTLVFNESHNTESNRPTTSYKADNYNSNQIFQVGDVVQICSDNEKMKKIQKGHGEWADAINPVSYKINLLKLYIYLIQSILFYIRLWEKLVRLFIFILIVILR